MSFGRGKEAFCVLSMSQASSTPLHEHGPQTSKAHPSPFSFFNAYLVLHGPLSKTSYHVYDLMFGA